MGLVSFNISESFLSPETEIDMYEVNYISNFFHQIDWAGCSKKQTQG